MLEEGGAQLAEMMFKIDEAHSELRRVGQLSPDTKTDLAARHKSIVLAMNRIGVRRGPTSSEYKTVHAYWLATSKVHTILDEAHGQGLDSEQSAAYSQAMSEALDAENAYLNATAETLTVDSSSMLKHVIRRLGRTATNAPSASR